MPPAVYAQNVIALIWDFDKTLSPDYMQKPLFEEYNVDPTDFWMQNNEYIEYYNKKIANNLEEVNPDTFYLNQIIKYIKAGIFKDLTNKKLQELGGKIRLSAGLPDFFDRTRAIALEPDFNKHDIRIEHYIVSTGLRAMIQGTALADKVDGIWACTLLPSSSEPSSSDNKSNNLLPVASTQVLSQVGYALDNTTKTKAIFEINKGINKDTTGRLDVNTRLSDDQRRVPFHYMIYIAHGPSDIPSFSVVGSKGGKCLAVYGEDPKEYENAASLEEQGRAHSIAPADYRPGKPADKWLNRAIRIMANEIVAKREAVFNSLGMLPEHVV